MKLLFYLLLYSSLLSPSSFSSEVKITSHPDYPPISWESGGSLKGASITLVKMALENIGYKAVFVPVGTWGRAQIEVKNGRIDILLPPYKTPEREIFFTFPEEPFLTDRTIILTKKGRIIKFKKFEDLKKYDGIGITNDSFGAVFDKADKEHGILKRFSNTQQCLEFLLRGRADFLIAGESAVSAIIQKLGLMGKFDIQEQTIIEAGMYTAISKKSVYNTKSFTSRFFKEMSKLIKQKAHLKAVDESLDKFSRESKEIILR